MSNIFFCVLLSRFGQSALESLFSTLRSKNPVPRPLEFCSAIRSATLSQLFKPSKRGSYTEDNASSSLGRGAELASTGANAKKVPVAFPDDVLDLSLGQSS